MDELAHRLIDFTQSNQDEALENFKEFDQRLLDSEIIQTCKDLQKYKVTQLLEHVQRTHPMKSDGEIKLSSKENMFRKYSVVNDSIMQDEL